MQAYSGASSSSRQGRQLLFVAPARQRRGIGRALVSAAIERARADVLMVSASLSSVPASLRLGFECSGEVAESSGLVCQPMRKPLIAAS